MKMPCVNKGIPTGGVPMKFSNNRWKSHNIKEIDHSEWNFYRKEKKKKTEESEPQKSEDIRNIRFKVQNMFQEIKKTKEWQKK